MPDRKPGLAEVTERIADVSSHNGRWIEMPEARQGTRLVAAAYPLKEERLEEKEDKPDPRIGPTLPLKKGVGHMEAGWARAWEKHLRDLLEEYPEHFRALQALVEGCGGGVSKQQLRELREWGYLARDRSPLPDVQAIMMAAFRKTPDGPCLVDPIDVKTPEAAATVQRFDEQGDEGRRRGMDRLLRRLRDQDPEQGNDRSR